MNQVRSESLRIPRTIWALGFVSLFMDVSSELVHSLLPVFLVTTLGASALTVGVIEGIAEATAMVVKVFSGAISDFIGRRKGLLLVGYGMAALSKPLFPLAHSVDVVFTARFLDRIGKGIRGSPRDALVADVAPPEIRGACFGLRQSMDTVGAFVGPALAIALMLWLADIQLVLWFAVIPAVIAVALIVAGVKEPEHAVGKHTFRSPIHWRVLHDFSSGYWWVVIVGGVFTLARFSEAFLVLRAQQAGLSATWVPLVMVVMSVFYALSAYPAGWLSDRISRTKLLCLGMGLLVLADLVLAQSHSPLTMMLGVALWGLHMGFSQGILATLVADTAPDELKGTAFGIFNLLSGVCLLIASVLAGWLWQTVGAQSTFITGAVLAALAMLLLLLRRAA
ncbi:multidrug transporter MdtH [Pseudomonas sp. FW306-02-F02-AA]|uniref:MFS transporter n=1 Tax=Pseudomonas fluorescens TaxID=294 RepID=A0A0N9W426_PSEFL|nr:MULTISPECIES: MFS transporter [Pseudomonas]ALI01083.1 MFS transporter [Pseudomonas fluorescens]PMZ01370.1 multidrug transporter MdtH [Pseudomonas sp. FW306-02-F02-AB]PMZ09893.1 multidrug transporter MdtH [Pseudomonas sp. FW306-02-H06C]PMZ16801.1 multidrug transporter MdtH [Pseudomonas sp. FW306-02-F02-AA]PMZ23730.1 multidrug transporter MdtH [Pseudomonas sp. FW306-02-F08-AA]